MDFVALAVIAQNLIESNGRPCTFTRGGRTPSDGTKPWRGSGGTLLEYDGVIAVITPSEFVPEKGEIAKRMLATLMVAHNSFSALDATVTADILRTLDSVNDGIQTWRIVKMAPLMPGITPIIYSMTVEA